MYMKECDGISKLQFICQYPLLISFLKVYHVTRKKLLLHFLKIFNDGFNSFSEICPVINCVSLNPQ